jgi:hypothetical protein
MPKPMASIVACIKPLPAISEVIADFLPLLLN